MKFKEYVIINEIVNNTQLEKHNIKIRPASIRGKQFEEMINAGLDIVVGDKFLTTNTFSFSGKRWMHLFEVVEVEPKERFGWKNFLLKVKKFSVPINIQEGIPILDIDNLKLIETMKGWANALI